MLKHALLAAVFALLTIAGSVRPAYADQFGATTRPPTPKPCDLLSGGCIDAWSVVETLAASYDGPLFQASRSDGSFQLIPAIPQTGIVNVGLLHQFCDGYDCWVATLYDQVGKNPLLANPSFPYPNQTNHMPLLYWKANGLPSLILSMNNDDWTTPANALVPSNAGTFLSAVNAIGLPTTGSRVTYIATDNGSPSGCCGIFQYGAYVPIVQEIGGDWDINVLQTNPNVASSVAFGGNLNNFYYTLGAYPPGFADLVGYMKYNQATAIVQDGVLTSACIPSTASPCNSVTTYLGPAGQTVNTGATASGPNPVTIGVGQEGDGDPYGGRFTGAALAAFDSSPDEDSAVLNAMAGVLFPKKPSACAAVRSAIAAPAWQGTANLNVTGSYNGPPALNLSNLVALWSTSLINADYTGPLFRAVRADTGVGFDIKPSGCEVAVTALTADCAGTTCTAPVAFDEADHGWQMRSTIPGNPPALSITGMNSLPCLNFTAQTFASFTASVAATGVMSVTAIASGTITTPTNTTMSGEFYPQVIQSQLSGTTGGIGTYQTSSPAAQASSGMVSNASQMLRTDRSVSRPQNGAPAQGLYQNMTVDLVYQPPTSYVPVGSIFNLEGGWSIAMGGGNTIKVYDATNNLYITSAPITLNQAHFISFQTNAATPQLLTLTVDNGTPVTATTSSTALGTSGVAFALGMGKSVEGSNGCVSMAAVYNDVETPAFQLALYQFAHAKWLTP